MRDWVGKVIHWKLCKKFKFDHANQLYMHNPEFVLENKTQRIQWDFEIQTNHLISARRPNLVKVRKKKKKKKRGKKWERERICWIVEFAVPTDHRVKPKESEKRGEYVDPAWELKKTIKHESDGDTNCNWRARYSQQTIGKRTGGLENKRTSGAETIETTALLRSARILGRDLRRLAVTQTPVENYQLTLVWRILKLVKQGGGGLEKNRNNLNHSTVKIS